MPGLCILNGEGTLLSELCTSHTRMGITQEFVRNANYQANSRPMISESLGLESGICFKTLQEMNPPAPDDCSPSSLSPHERRSRNHTATLLLNRPSETVGYNRCSLLGAANFEVWR
nr:retinal cone rhodopsin-sensitive cGMP 3',5'-cyclic phosphodiesterase subunit gamma isoform X2 [Mirounga angustirostris]